MMQSNQYPKTHARERGGMMIFLLLITLVIIFFAALAIDATRLTASHSELRRSAELIALGALASFHEHIPISSDPMTALGERISEAATRAEELAQTSRLVGLNQQSFFHDLTAVVRYADSAPANQANLELHPGNWWFVEPDEGCASYTYPGVPQSCPCDAGSFPGACFQHSESTDTVVNAFRVLVLASGDTSIKSTLANTFGIKETNINSQGTAAFTPRRGVFAIDLSGSIVLETHPAMDSGTLQNRYAFKMEGADSTHPDCTGNGGALQCVCPADGTTNLCPDNTSCQLHNFDHFYYNGFWDDVILDWGVKPIPDSRGVITGPPTSHFKDDYACYRFEYNDITDPANPLPQVEHYLAETQWVNATAGSNYYIGPEPLSSILAGIRTSLDFFEDRAVAGDMVGIVGFGTDPYVDKRILDLTAPRSTNVEFETIKRIAHGDGVPPLSVREERVQNGFFPRYGSQTNLPLALLKAQDMIVKLSASGTADNFVVLFTDALSTCVLNGTTVDCDSTHTYWINSQTWMKSVIDQYEQSEIALHTFLVGNYVQPHTYLTPSKSTTGCMGEEEFRSLGWDYVEHSIPSWPPSGTTLTNIATAWGNTSPTQPFTYANYLYEYSEQSNGFWLPIRPCCENASGVCTDVTSFLDTQCDATPTTAFKGGEIFRPATNAAPYTDGSGRLICNGEGLDQRAQIVQGMEQIMLKTPYTLVE